ncbi:hepatocellular carcinoma-associated antigen 59 [Ancylostoma caninum]|uniref:Hepatocellular carcinoma-associated antigen 59 n=1 Tax=Ancylostoma caninum TaxID=29170 RepID=A0A368HCS8_ANCCA|nr:hepatocellular carcinoma-associated antigen 59 [Ancylostoma caninum]
MGCADGNNCSEEEVKGGAVAEPTPSTTSPSSSDRPCIEMFEEKQLMAVQSMLRQDILEEKRRIARLCWKLRGCEVEQSQPTEVPQEQQAVDGRKSMGEESEEVWRERCALEEAARAALIAEIVRLRNDCATLRAKIEQAGQTQMFVTMSFNKPKKKIQTRQRVEDDDSDDGDTRRINDIRELQKSRERKNGLTEIECAVGKEKAAALEDGIQMAGGTMALTGKQKARIEAAGIEAGIREQFEKETMLRDEHEELRKFIDQGLRRERGETSSSDQQGGSQVDVSVECVPEVRHRTENCFLQESDVLMRAAMKLKGYRSEASNELLSEHMLAGIPEVDLGINARISNILETEKKKSELLEQALERARNAAANPRKPVEDEPVLKRFAL